MGILTRRQGGVFVITSDRDARGDHGRRAPKRLTEAYQVWTGARWSQRTTDALTFASLDEADEYVRAHYVQVSA